jgi:hypothetical protein
MQTGNTDIVDDTNETAQFLGNELRFFSRRSISCSGRQDTDPSTSGLDSALVSSENECPFRRCRAYRHRDEAGANSLELGRLNAADEHSTLSLQQEVDCSQELLDRLALGQHDFRHAGSPASHWIHPYAWIRATR